jgi:L-seryl-tRNA(Ser) seleniumtransferase
MFGNLMASRAKPMPEEKLQFGVATPPPRGQTTPPIRSDDEAPKESGRRAIPSVDTLLRSVPAKKASLKFGRAVVRHSLRRALDDIRAEAARNGGVVPEESVILARAVGAAARDYYGITEVINATGVVLHTGLGRAPLPERAAAAAAEAARGYADLEVERETGARGRRTARAESLLCALTGAEDALIVNNNAAALMLALAALAPRRDVLVSRGELIEIGGEFRLPEIMAVSGAKLIEVGTTNRTRAKDYEKAIGRRTGLILKVHPSNYRVVGFAATVALQELVRIGGEHGVPVMYDVGSGLLDHFPEVPDEEPSVAEAITQGGDLVTFSGDKLLGGPQAGIVAGRAELIEKLRLHPLARALRVDKMTVAALEAVLRLYATDRRLEIPLWRLLSARQSKLMDRARAIASVFRPATARPGEAVVGGGSLPGYGLPSAEVVVSTDAPTEVAARLRQGRPAVFCRIDDGALVFDLRTVPPEDDDRLLRAVRYALEQS